MQTGSTFDVTVDDIGTFVFQRRTLDAQFKIEAEAARMLGGDTASDSLYRMAVTFATLKKLTVHAPDGWTIDDIDPLDDEQMDRVQKVFGRLRVAEETFRSGAKPKRPDVGATA